jgi:Flp pilus assembly protein TadG
LFLQDRRGSVVPMFALAVIPVVGLIGAAVDYSRANSLRSGVQAALDATALAMARSAPTLTEDQLKTQAAAHFAALFNKPGAKNIDVNTVYSTTNGSTLTITATGAMDTTFTRVMGYNQINIGSSATIKWGNQRLRVALALDTTGSMASAGKIDALKTATKNLLDQLKAAASVDGDVYVSIIPFSKDVNVGTGNRDATWLHWDDGTDKSWDGANGTCSKSGYSPRSSCQAQNTCSLSGYNSQNSCTSAGTCSISGNNTQNDCNSAGTCSNPGQNSQWSCTNDKASANSGYTWKSACQGAGYAWGYGTWTPATWTPGVWSPAVWTPKAHTDWNGCVTDRGSATAPGTNAGNDQNITTPSTGDTTTLFYPEQYGYCSPEMKGLNYNWTTMKTAVDGLYPNGSTNQPIGLVWAWQSLVGGGPMTMPAKDANYTYKEVIILLSDGLNTQNRWNGNGSDHSTSVDNRMYYGSGGGIGTCKNIKDTGIIVYTIQVNTGGDPESALLRNCASDGKFVMLTTANQIVTTFQTIGTALSQLRISK